MGTPVERKQKERDTRRAEGLVRLEVWVRPEVRDEVRAFAEKRTRAAVRAEVHELNRLNAESIGPGGEVYGHKDGAR